MTISRLGLHLPRLPQRFDSLLLAAFVLLFLWAKTPSALAGQAKTLVKVVIGYGSTDGGVAVLGFAQETKLFEKHGLDVVLVGMLASLVGSRWDDKMYSTEILNYG